MSKPYLASPALASSNVRCNSGSLTEPTVLRVPRSDIYHLVRKYKVCSLMLTAPMSEAALSKLGDAQLHRPGARLPVAVTVALHQTLSAFLAICGAGEAVNLQFLGAP
jgi:hypothetical protein